MTHKKIFSYCIIGTTLEWYDFALFGVLSPLLSQIFFPAENKHIALVMTLAVFAAGYIMRPLGAVFFGHIGDKYGRKPAIILSVMAMTVATVAMGLLPILPTHALAVVLMLVTLRLVQGFAVSGESAGVATFLSELISMNDKRYFFKQGFIWSGCMLGILLGSLIGGLAFSFNHQYAFAWRLPFLLSICLGVIGLYFRLKAIETPLFQRIMDSKETVTLPVWVAFRDWWQTIAASAILCLFCTSFIYFLLLIIPEHFAPHHIIIMQSIVLATLVIFAPFFAYITNSKNAIKMAIIGLCLIALLSFILIFALSKQTSLAMVMFVSFLMGLAYSVFQSTFGTLIVISYANNVRYTGIGLGMNMAVMLAGLFPLLSTVTIKETGSILPVAGMISLMALAVAILLFAVRRKVFSVHDAQIRIVVKS